MISNEGYQDRVLVCRECGQDFIFSAGEQAFYASRGLVNSPGRCATCRALRRAQQGGASTRTRSEQYATVCATCGRATTVPFIPREDRPVYCNECFQAQRASRDQRQSSYSYNYGDSKDGGHGSWGGGSREGRGGRNGGRDNRSGRERRTNRDERDYYSW